jgi:putative hydrolase of the HAD superfamily
VRYPFVLLDAGGTLLGPSVPYGLVYARELREVGVELDPAPLDAAIGETSRAMARLLPAGADRFGQFPEGESGFWLRFIAEVLRRAAPAAAEPDLARRALERLSTAFGRADAWRVYDDVPAALRELRRSGARLGVVSNWDSRLPRLLEALGLARYFDTLAVSHLEGVEKPDPALFRRAMTRLGATPERTLHVGDSLVLDVAGAGAAGIAALLLDRSGRSDAERTGLPDLSTLPHIAQAGV